MVVFITDPFPESVPAHTLDRRTIAIENGFLAEALVKVNICFIPYTCCKTFSEGNAAKK